MTDKPQVTQSALTPIGKLRFMFDAGEHLTLSQIREVFEANAQLQQQVGELTQLYELEGVHGREMAGTINQSLIKAREQIASLEAQLVDEKTRYDSLYTAAISGVRIEQSKEQRIAELEAAVKARDEELKWYGEHDSGLRSYRLWAKAQIEEGAKRIEELESAERSRLADIERIAAEVSIEARQTIDLEFQLKGRNHELEEALRFYDTNFFNPHVPGCREAKALLSPKGVRQ